MEEEEKAGGRRGMKGATTGCKARVCDNNFRLIMMRVMASRVSVAITLHEASGAGALCCSWGKQMTPHEEELAPNSIIICCQDEGVGGRARARAVAEASRALL